MLEWAHLASNLWIVYTKRSILQKFIWTSPVQASGENPEKTTGSRLRWISPETREFCIRSCCAMTKQGLKGIQTKHAFLPVWKDADKIIDLEMELNPGNIQLYSSASSSQSYPRRSYRTWNSTLWPFLMKWNFHLQPQKKHSAGRSLR